MSGASDLLSMASARIKELEARLKFQDEWLSNGVYYTTDEAFKLHDDYNTKIAELTTKLAIQQTMPMKYKRMAFNAQLQKENDELTAKLDKAREALNSCIGGDDYYNRPIIEKALQELDK